MAGKHCELATTSCARATVTVSTAVAFLQGALPLVSTAAEQLLPLSTLVLPNNMLVQRVHGQRLRPAALSLAAPLTAHAAQGSLAHCCWAIRRISIVRSSRQAAARIGVLARGGRGTLACHVHAVLDKMQQLHL